MRDTIVTWLARAGVPILEIKSITGHSLASIMTTIRHYVSIDRSLSREAVRKLEGWLEQEGVKL